MAWAPAETNTHQDHVIAHVIGATPLGHFVWDETAYILLDIGFIWNIYLDMEMGLLATANEEASPIESVELFENGDERRLVMNCEQESVVIETSLSHRWTRIYPRPSAANT